MSLRKNFDDFIQTFDSDNTAKVAKSLCVIGEYDYSNCTPVDLQNIILGMNPNSPKAITTIIYILGLYAKYLGNKDMEYMLNDLDRNILWSLAKPNASKKFISNAQFEKIYHDIGMYEDYNGFYIQTLFRSLYEAIYSDDMSVVKNLRAENIWWDGATLKPDNGEPYDISISEKLADDLIKLSEIDIWERRNRYGTCKISIVGLHEDSCFKVENRKGSSEYSYRFSYYRLLRNISKNYVGYNLLPLQIYVSGIMHRITLELDKCGIDIKDAFADNNKDRKVNGIISDELKRSMCDTPVRNFREMVKGHIDIFSS